MVKQMKKTTEDGMAKELKARLEWLLEGWLFRRSQLGRAVSAARR